ncbi:hypothetical protein CLOM_g10490 [Closterium sp. NIES-68]|nr:hypothetical protein CLOM_g10490 [Closterium sp. NIES-68]GJP62072.1 hypothetical protein CLOP_g19173 [Closterium sp. NIES-67]GJP77985.1 hypothetical protein CLOP_g8303 [Closterium sp. NIES-67]GJP82877.1 hypothetical protein CLOP_g13103 [Closterium sp. NIES-67]
MDPDALAKAFVQHYYTTFDTSRNNLYALYQDQSMLTFEGEKFQGVQNIQNKISSLPFQSCTHIVSTVDCQPSGPGGGMVVFVSGSLKLADQEHPLKFSQMFHLMPTPAGSFYVLNDIFRLNYG